MPDACRPIDTLAPGTPLAEALDAQQPWVARDLVAHWPLIGAGRESAAASAAYLARFANDALPATATIAPPEAQGRIFYDHDLRGFNFRHEQVPLRIALRTLLNYLDADAPPMIYLGATTLDTFLPGLSEHLPLDLGGRDALASIWIGNRTRVPAHQDLPDNLACVCAGRRRVTLLPPEQLANLYVGPLDVTPAGQPVSLVDFAAPDHARFPRFAEALRHARTAELGPGDAVFIPSMWWHHMEALDGFNVLLNYWWRRSPAWMETPFNTLIHALTTLRDLPPNERAIWQEVFRHYVFEADAGTVAHIPEAARGVLGALGEAQVRAVRDRLRQRMER